MSAAWALPEGGIDAQVAALAARLGAEVEGPTAVTRHLLDTFDDRLWAVGERLVAEVVEQTPGVRVRREAPDGARRPGRAAVDAVPSVPAELPEGVLSRAVTAASDVRCWLPRATTTGSRWRLVVRDGLDKRRVTVLVDAHVVDGVEVARQGRLRRVRGHDAEADRAAEVLAEAGAVPLDDPWTPLRQACGHPPGAYQPRPEVGLLSDERADVGVLRLLGALRDVMAANHEGTAAALDPEFLHEYRVALRRMRSLLKAMKSALPPHGLAEVRAVLKDLGARTGPVRDLDVHVMQLPALAARLPEEMHADLAPLEAMLRRDRQRAHAGLARTLRSDGHRARMAQVDAWLDAPPPLEPSASKATVPLGRLAGARTWKQFQLVRRIGRSVTDETPDPVLHDLRKDVKALRYLPELLPGALPPGLCRKAVKQIKPLQSVLGELQDAFVQAEAMQGFAARLVQDQAPTASVLALGALVREMHQRRAEARAAFAEAFAAVDGAEVEDTFRALREAG